MTKYKILIKYKSTSNKVFYYFYKQDDSSEDYFTSDTTELKTVIRELDSKIGYENIRIIVDISYDINTSVDEMGNNIEFLDEVETKNLYDTAFEKVFGKSEDNEL